MKLSSLIRTENIIIGSTASTKLEAIEEMYSLLARRYKLSLANIKDPLKAVMDREELGGTVFASGIAVPHARLDNLDDLIISILVPEKPILCDNVEVKIFVLILTSKTVSNTYLNTLATFMKMSRNKTLFENWLKCPSGDKMMQFFDDNNITIKKDITVEDIMVQDVITINQNSTMRELIDIFYKYNLGFLPVVDDSGNFIGEVNLISLMEKSIPDYASQMANLKFLNSFEPLEKLFREEDTVLVKDIMVKPTITFRKDISLINAALEFITNRRRQIPVTEGDKIVGIVSLKDILQKVLRG